MSEENETPEPEMTEALADPAGAVQQTDAEAAQATYDPEDIRAVADACVRPECDNVCQQDDAFRWIDDEQEELKGSLERLDAFLDSPNRKTDVSIAERNRLQRQRAAMHQYLMVLRERIRADFK